MFKPAEVKESFRHVYNLPKPVPLCLKDKLQDQYYSNLNNSMYYRAIKNVSVKLKRRREMELNNLKMKKWMKSPIYKIEQKYKNSVPLKLVV